MSKRLLVLGATGFAGRHFVKGARSTESDVVTSSRTGRDADVACDLLRPDTIAEIVRSVAPDCIVNLAGAASAARSYRDPVATFSANSIGVLNLLKAVAQNRPEAHVVCISSGEVYGDVKEADLPIREEYPPLPLSPYGTSKAAMELICGQYARTFNLRTTLIRSFNHTGPGQSPTFAASSFAEQISEAERRGDDAATIATGNLELVRDFSDVRDIVRAYLEVCDQGITGTFNACSGHGIPLTEIVDNLQSATPLRVVARTDLNRLRQREVQTMYGSYERLHAATGWQPKIPLTQTLEDLLAWWRKRHARA